MTLLTTISEDGMSIIIILALVAFFILLAYQIRTNYKHSQDILNLMEAVAVLRVWYGTQGENVEWLKGQLGGQENLPNAAHSPDVEEAVRILMGAGVMRTQAYEVIYKAMQQRGKHPVSFAEKFVQLQQLTEQHEKGNTHVH